MRVTLRQVVTAASTIVVALVLAISVPVSQLHTASTQSQCCCPDPGHCKCPEHKPDRRPDPSMRACHKTTQHFVSPVLPVFVTPVDQVALAPQAAATEVVFVHRTPHAPPTQRRPDAPS